MRVKTEGTSLCQSNLACSGTLLPPNSDFRESHTHSFGPLTWSFRASDSMGSFRVLISSLFLVCSGQLGPVQELSPKQWSPVIFFFLKRLPVFRGLPHFFPKPLTRTTSRPCSSALSAWKPFPSSPHLFSHFAALTLNVTSSKQPRWWQLTHWTASLLRLFDLRDLLGAWPRAGVLSVLVDKWPIATVACVEMGEVGKSLSPSYPGLLASLIPGSRQFLPAQTFPVPPS